MHIRVNSGTERRQTTEHIFKRVLSGDMESVRARLILCARTIR